MTSTTSNTKAASLNLHHVAMAAASLLLSTQAHTRNLYVSASGNDAVPYASNSATRPWRSITRAGEQARAGDTVFIGAGSYTQRLVVKNNGTAAAPITFQTTSGSKDVVIKKYTVNISGKNYITIKNLTVRDVYLANPSQGGDSIGIAVAGPSVGVTISGNIVYNTTGSAIAAWGTGFEGRTATYDYKGIKNLLIENNLIIDAVVNGWNEAITIANGVDNFTIRNNTLRRSFTITNSSGGEAIDVKEGASNGYIHGNRISQYNGNAIYLDGGGLQFSDGSYNYTPSNPPKLRNINIYGNTIANNPCMCNAIMLAAEGHGAMDGINIYNNLIYKNGGSGVTVYAHPSMRPDSVIANVNIANNSFYNNGWISGQTGNYHSDIDIDTYNVAMAEVTTRFKNFSIRNNAQFKSVGDVRRGIWVAYPELGYVAVSNNSDPTVQDNDSAPVNPYVNADAGDLRLYAGSPAADAGAVVGTVGVPRTDITGAARPKGLGVDIGAYESF
jgi:Disaggregatase related